MSEAMAEGGGAVGASLFRGRSGLKEAREAAGLHIAALAAALKVPVKKLEALEAGRYGELPDLTFARALASSACRQLKVDPAPILQQIPLSASPKLGEHRHSLNAPFNPGRDEEPINPLSWLSRPALLAAIALLLGALVIVFLPRAESPPPVASVAEPAMAEPVVVAEPVAAQEPTGAAVQEGVVPAGADMASPAVVPASTAVVAGVRGSSPQRGGGCCNTSNSNRRGQRGRLAEHCGHG